MHYYNLPPALASSPSLLLPSSPSLPLSSPSITHHHHHYYYRYYITGTTLVQPSPRSIFLDNTETFASLSSHAPAHTQTNPNMIVF
jgi:hypothetical protein